MLNVARGVALLGACVLLIGCADGADRIVGACGDTARAVVTGTFRGVDWRVEATDSPDWPGDDSPPYAMTLSSDGPVSHAGCGTTGPPEEVWGIQEGGGLWPGGDQYVYLYGWAKDPVETIVVTFEDGSTTELTLMESEGFDRRFFGTVTDLHRADLQALDASGRPVPREG